MAPPALQVPTFGGLEMLLVQEEAADGAGATIQILVGAPGSEVNLPIVQLKRHVADGVRQIPANVAALLFVCVCLFDLIVNYI